MTATSHQCMWCGRVGTRMFVRFESHYLCASVRACERRRRRGIPASTRFPDMRISAP